MGVGGHGCERVPESMFYAYGGAETRWQEVNSKLRSPLPQNLIDEKLARAIQEESLTKEARDAKKRAREELQEVHEESYSTQAPTPIANVSGGQEGGCSSTPGASSHMGESRSAPPIVSSSQIHANVSKKSKQHVAPHLQTTLASRFAPKLKKEAEIAEQQFFYQCNLAFRIARSPAYHRFYNTLVFAAAAGATGLRPVNAEALRTTHLKSRVAHIKKELSTSQLDKLVYVNANLKLLERLRLRDGNGGVLQWKVKDIDASIIANLERGLARGEAIDITFIQQRSDEDLAYDFLREEQTRFRRVTRAQARALQLPIEPPTMDAGVGPSTRGRSTWHVEVVVVEVAELLEALLLSEK
ncbi:hypothetical protein L7F22_013017 [Adiantum nelumboides]|nr:hypothetical protein [Adiantum nelumboides]